MRSVSKIVLLMGAFIVIGGIAGYGTLRFIVKSEDTVIVPNLVGKDVVYALEMLTDLGLNTKVSGYAYRTDVPKDAVARQEPGAGTEVKKDRDIRIVISKGPETVKIPDLKGLDLREASIVVADNGLNRGAVTEVYDATMGVGTIGSQFPPSGTVVKRGTAVDFLVGLGERPSMHKMPDLESLPLEDAVTRLQRFHLGLGHIQYTQKAGFPEDVVVGQDPQPGYPVAAGRSVRLSVNRQKEAVSHRGGLAFIHYPVEHGFLKAHVRIQLHAYGYPYDIVDAFLRPGSDIWMAVPQEEQSVLLVFHDDELVRSCSLSSSRQRRDLLEGWKWDASGGKIGSLDWKE